jgi:CRP-like cAMP-binding protein
MSELVANQVLAQLPAESLEALSTKLLRETLTPWQLLRDEHQTIERVYFPISGILSIVSLTEDGSIAESYTAGRDGMAGGEALFGTDRLIFRTMCQVPGVVYSMSTADFLERAQSDVALRRTVYLYLHCLLSLAGQSGACNLLHGLTERCARWLLLTQDRVGKDSFELTHDILSTMLGVHRPAVTIAAGTLQKAGLISYTRGRITITDRAGLENASCECYGVVEREFRRVLGGP